MEWYQKAVDQGNASAQCNLAFGYDNGEGVAKDLKKAVEWYQKAADQGNAMARKNLADLQEKMKKSKSGKKGRKRPLQSVAQAEVWILFPCSTGSFDR